MLSGYLLITSQRVIPEPHTRITFVGVPRTVLSQFRTRPFSHREHFFCANEVGSMFLAALHNNSLEPAIWYSFSCINILLSGLLVCFVF